MTNWLSADEMRAWRAFIGTNADLLGALEADLALQGVDLGDYQVLVYLSEAAGTIRCGCAISPSSCSSRRAASPAASTAS